MTLVERYEREPLLAIIESYALDVIGELTPEEVDEAACAVEEVLGDGDDWRAAVRRELRWAAAIDDDIAARWRRFLHEPAAAVEDDHDAAEFARRFADDALRLSRC